MNMTIDQVIAMGESLKGFRDGVQTTAAYDVPPGCLPPGCPLYTSLSGAGNIFDMGENTLRILMKKNADFPALRLGKKVLVDVLGLYEWLHARNGTTLIEE